MVSFTDFIRKHGKEHGFAVDPDKGLVFHSACLHVTFTQDAEGKYHPLRSSPVGRATLVNPAIDLMDPEAAAKRLTLLSDRFLDGHTEEGKKAVRMQKKGTTHRAAVKRAFAHVAIDAGRVPEREKHGPSVKLNTLSKAFFGA